MPGALIALKPTLLNFNTPAFGFLIKRAFGPPELPFLIDAIFSSRDESDIIRRIRSGDDAQTFIDVINEARSVFACHRQTQPIDVDAYGFVIRRLIGLSFRRRFGRNASDRCTRFAAATLLSREL